MMHRICFVDDEQRVLSGLRRQLHARRDEWELRFVDGGEAALAALAQQPVDAVVSDMRMPGMDGAQLLARVAETWPDTARLVLSGHADSDRVQEARAVAHRYLHKPCPPELLESELREMLSARALLQSLGWDQAMRVWGLPPGRVPTAAPLFALLGMEADAVRLHRELDAHLDEHAPLAESVGQILGLPEGRASGERLRAEIDARSLAGLALAVRFAETFGTEGALARAIRVGAASRGAGTDATTAALAAAAALHELSAPGLGLPAEQRRVLEHVLSTWGASDAITALLGRRLDPAAPGLPNALSAAAAALAVEPSISPSSGSARLPIRNT